MCTVSEFLASIFFHVSMQEEAEALVTLLRDFPDAKVWVAFSCKVSQFYKIYTIVLFLYS